VCTELKLQVPIRVVGVCVSSGATEVRVCRPAGSLGQWTASGDTGRDGGTVRAPAAAALKPVLADVTVPGTSVVTVSRGTVKNSSITTKHLYLTLTFRSHHEIFIRRSWYSVLPSLDATISCRIKKAVGRRRDSTDNCPRLDSRTEYQLLLMKIS